MPAEEGLGPMDISAKRNAATPSRRRTTGIRLAFVVCLAILPAELLVARVFGEPYPALFQPAFVGSPQVGPYALVEVPHVFVRNDDGIREIPYRTVIPKSDQLGTSILRSMFGTPSRANAPETVAWLRTAVREAYPDLTGAVSVEIEWRLGMYHVDGGGLKSEKTVREVTIDLEPK